MRRLFAAGALGFVAALAVADSAVVVGQSRQAVVLRFGEPVRVINPADQDAPGLYMKWPLIDHVVGLDKRNQPLHPDPQQIVAADQRAVSVDAVLRYRIADPLQFYRALGGPAEAEARLQRMVDAGVRQGLDGASSGDILSGRREALADKALADIRAEAKAERLGIEAVDLRLLRVGLPPADAQAVLHRMQVAQAQQAIQIRAAGEQKRREIMAGADEQVAILRGDAEGKAEQVRGEGDAKRIALLGAAYGKDPAFARYFRQLEAYENTLEQGDATLVLSRDNAFLHDFANGPAAR